jgi:hypothetical protein
MQYKFCNQCQEDKDVLLFSKNKSQPDGLDFRCKKCESLYRKLYKKTKRGLCLNIHHEQVSSSNDRKHPLPSYTSEELVDWINQQTNFDDLYDAWVLSNYSKWTRPSVDRLDNNKPYTLDNIRLITFKENNDRSHIDASNGEFQELKSVDCFDLDSNFICSYKSISEAARQTGMTSGAIHAACNKANRAAKKYLWKYSADTTIPVYTSRAKTYIQYNEDGSIKYESNNRQQLFEYLGVKDLSPILAAIKKNRTYHGFKWGVK